MTYAESLEEWGLAEKNIDGIRSDVHRIHEDAKRMQHLVTDLLLLSSIDSQALQMRMEAIDLNGLLRQTADRLFFSAEAKQMEILCFNMASLPPVFGDRPSLERIFSNLISNAIKYSNPQTSIKIFMGTVHDVAYVKISDSGLGIDKKHLNKIFDRFYRVDMTGSRIHGGTGLGLAIVKELVEMHNGQIVVQSALGRGTTFTVMLPFAQSVHEQTLAALEQGRGLNNSIQLASLNQLMQMARPKGLVAETVQEITPSDIKLMRSLISSDRLAEEEIHIAQRNPALGTEVEAEIENIQD